MKTKKKAAKIVDTLGLLGVSAVFLLPFVWMLLTSVKNRGGSHPNAHSVAGQEGAVG